MSVLLGPTRTKTKRTGSGASKAESSTADSFRRTNATVGLSRKSKAPGSERERQYYIQKETHTDTQRKICISNTHTHWTPDPKWKQCKHMAYPRAPWRPLRRQIHPSKGTQREQFKWANIRISHPHHCFLYLLKYKNNMFLKRTLPW